MDRHAIFVDAGYFYAAGTQAAFGAATSRKLVSVRAPDALIKELAIAAVLQVDAKPLLRVYWYDAMPGPRLSLDQSAIAFLPAVKLRLGALNSAGEQKGVDSLIVTDLIELARNGAISDAVLVAGDEDLRIAVQLAQSFGVKVHILAAGNPSQNVSPSLQMEADSVSALNGAWFGNHFIKATAPTTAATFAAKPAIVRSATTKEISLTDAAVKVCAELLDEATAAQVTGLREHFKTQQSVPPEFDRKLIARVAALLDERKLTGDEMRSVRGVFVQQVRSKAS